MSLQLCVALLALLLGGCANSRSWASTRPFLFHADSFAFANETVWEYHPDPATGKILHRRRVPAPSYGRRCFVVARSARQFFQFARFDPGQPVSSDETYRHLIERVVSLDPSRERPEAQRIVIPDRKSVV